MVDHKYMDTNQMDNLTGLKYFFLQKVCKDPTNGVITGVEDTYLVLPEEILDIIGKYLISANRDYGQDEYVENVLGEFTTILDNDSFCNIL